MNITKVQIIDFLKSVNNDFNPPLSDKIIFSEYADKIINKANFVYRLSTENKLIGLIVFYCNNDTSLQAFITFVAVSKDFRGKGIAKEMIEEIIEFVKKQKYKTISLEANNPIAISLYQKIGFKIVKDEDWKYMILNI